MSSQSARFSSALMRATISSPWGRTAFPRNRRYCIHPRGYRPSSFWRSLKYEPSSEPLHISADLLGLGAVVKFEALGLGELVVEVDHGVGCLGLVQLRFQLGDAVRHAAGGVRMLRVVDHGIRRFRLVQLGFELRDPVRHAATRHAVSIGQYSSAFVSTSVSIRQHIRRHDASHV